MAEQLFAALVGGTGNGRLSFAPLPYRDAEMWTGNKPSPSFCEVAGLPAQGLVPVAGCSAEHPAQSSGKAAASASQSAIAPGKRCIIAPWARDIFYSESVPSSGYSA
ncbi:MAG: hypothetical protein IJI45_15155 [Anaerolineaceae bacterium]|nr:hypothetical protein [Anaerolineaceae bacterium]